jgi:hypothetical protein
MTYMYHVIPEEIAKLLRAKYTPIEQNVGIAARGAP